MPTMPAVTTPSRTFAASLSRCMLQVFPSYHIAAMPIWALSRSAGESPVPSSIACEAPCERGWVMRELVRLMAFIGVQYP